MKFDCKEIDISDEEFGCTLTLREKKDRPYDPKISIKELMTPNGEYLILQRTYGEDDFETDYCHFESSDFEKSDVLKEFIIDLFRGKFILTNNEDIFEITFNNVIVNDKIFEKLKRIIKKITNGNGQLQFHD